MARLCMSEIYEASLIGETPPNSLHSVLDSDWKNSSYATLYLDSVLRNLGPLSEFTICSFVDGRALLHWVLPN